MRCFSKLWIAVGNISAGFSCSDRSMDWLLGSPQTCPDRRWINWYKHLKLCCMVHPYFGCCYDSSGFFSLISEVSNSCSPRVYIANHDLVYCIWVFHSWTKGNHLDKYVLLSEFCGSSTGSRSFDIWNNDLFIIVENF